MTATVILARGTIILARATIILVRATIILACATIILARATITLARATIILVCVLLHSGHATLLLIIFCQSNTSLAVKLKITTPFSTNLVAILPSCSFLLLPRQTLPPVLLPLLSPLLPPLAPPPPPPAPQCGWSL